MRAVRSYIDWDFALSSFSLSSETPWIWSSTLLYPAIPFFFSSWLISSSTSPARSFKIYLVRSSTETSALISERTFFMSLNWLFFTRSVAAYCLKSSLLMYFDPFCAAYYSSLSRMVFSKASFSTSSFLSSSSFCSFFLLTALACDL